MNWKEANDLIQTLVGCRLINRYRFSETELFGFHLVKDDVPCTDPSVYALHALCGLKIIFRSEVCKRKVSEITGDSTTSEFLSATQSLIGEKIHRITINEDMDLWIDLGDYWLVVITYKEADDAKREAWRFWSVNRPGYHLVASHFSIQLE